MFVFLLIFPFKDIINSVCISLSRQILRSPDKISEKIFELESNNLILNLKLQKYKSLQEENSRLKKALNFHKENKIRLTGAEVISFDPSNWRRIVVIDTGKNNGITKGLFAINEEGYLVGKITEVGDNYSKLTLINDPDFSLPVFVGDEELGLLKGGLSGINILYIEEGDKIKENDKVWCKILQSALPLYAGEVKQIKKDRNSLFWNVEVQPFTENAVLHRVFIVSDN